MLRYNYLEEAKEHEKVFRLFLDKFKVPHQDLTLEEIYKRYSEGNRNGVWTILNFKKVLGGANIFYFSHEDVAFMSGGGRADFWKVKDDTITFVNNESIWMS
jgi:hypothetical protein